MALKLCKTWSRAAGMESFAAEAAEPGGAGMTLNTKGLAAERTSEDEDEEVRSL